MLIVGTQYWVPAPLRFALLIYILSKYAFDQEVGDYSEHCKEHSPYIVLAFEV